MVQHLDWDYTDLADAYLSRPGYADAAIDRVAEITDLKAGSRVLDLGAGAGHLTIPLARRGCSVIALEPNAAMRARGVQRTCSYGNVSWVDGVMEATGQAAGSLNVCAYGSSFGVVDRLLTLREAARILEGRGWFVSVFNHRDLSDPLQNEIERFIQSCIPDFSYGTRREGNAGVLEASGLFERAVTFEVSFVHSMPVAQWVEAWRSHNTLRRQAGARFSMVVDGIAGIVARSASDVVDVPYVTRACVAQRRLHDAGLAVGS